MGRWRLVDETKSEIKESAPPANPVEFFISGVSAIGLCRDR
jgi:hypothetical protein